MLQNNDYSSRRSYRAGVKGRATVGFINQNKIYGTSTFCSNVQNVWFVHKKQKTLASSPSSPIPQRQPTTFQGYLRSDGRVGTRNYILILGASVDVAPMVRAVEKKLKDVTLPSAISGFCVVAHSESLHGNNATIVRRCLRHFVTHPNIARAVVVHAGDAAVAELCAEHVTCVEGEGGAFEASVAKICAVAKAQIPQAAACARTAVPASALSVALQCGGSDAFSGISGNPIAGLAAKLLLEQGGKALLAETDELIGAEAYIMKGATEEAQRDFLAMIDRYKEYAGRHGHSAEGNPSYGNKLRGLYNIAIKSIGAAMKKHPQVPLEACVEYGCPMPPKTGYYFMDSPGNDLESVAGQVASGCTIIYFITGNGSITNFPFVPTLKIMTTDTRFQLLQYDMDFNGGRLQRGESMDALAQDLWATTLRVAGGERSVGEHSKQSQVLLWRDWTVSEHAAPAQVALVPLEAPVCQPGPLEYRAFAKGDSYAADEVVVVFGTSLCSGEVALQIAREIETQTGRRCVALPHTEGCG